MADYNHNLITALGLTNDTAAYSYVSSGITEAQAAAGTYAKATKAKLALDQLYDLVATALKNTYTYAGGKATAESGKTTSTVSFTKDTTGDQASLENYYIHVTDGSGNVTNIELDARDFVKDGMLVKTRLVYNTTNSLSQTWEEGKSMTADTLPSTAQLTKDEDHPYTFIELVTKKPKDPDAEQEFDYVFIKAEDLIGDLVAGDGINKSGLTLSVNISPTGGLKFDDKKLAVKLNETQDIYVPLSVDADGIKSTTHNSDIYINGTWKGTNTATNAEVSNYANIINNVGVDSKTSLTFSQETADTATSKSVATNLQLVQTANILQKEIESLKNAGKNTNGNGTVTYSGTTTLAEAVNAKYAGETGTTIDYSLKNDDAVIVVSKTKTSGEQEFDVVTVVANSTDISNLFIAD